MSVTRASMDYEQAGELKIGQVGIANLRIRTLDVDQLIREMRERVERAPKLFGRAAVIVDFGGLSQVPDVTTATALIDGLRGAGVLPVALAYGTRDTETLSEALGLPLPWNSLPKRPDLALLTLRAGRQWVRQGWRWRFERVGRFDAAEAADGLLQRLAASNAAA